jgi:hypothetical protein
MDRALGRDAMEAGAHTTLTGKLIFKKHGAVKWSQSDRSRQRVWSTVSSALVQPQSRTRLEHDAHQNIQRRVVCLKISREGYVMYSAVRYSSRVRSRLIHGGQIRLEQVAHHLAVAEVGGRAVDLG